MAVVIGLADGCACAATFECGFIVATRLLHPRAGANRRARAAIATTRNVFFILLVYGFTEFEATFAIRRKTSPALRSMQSQKHPCRIRVGPIHVPQRQTPGFG
jgi:hypothetical protein